MALTVIKANEIKEFIPECQQDEPIPTIFGLKPVTGMESSQFVAGFMNAKETVGRGRNQREIYDAEKLEKNSIKQFCSLVKYVKNFYMPVDGDVDNLKLMDMIDKPEDINYIARNISPEIRTEVTDASFTIFSVSAGEKKT